MNETYVTLRGWLGGEVRHRLAGETPVAEFRLGVTPRYFDKQRSDWVDGDTQWFTVKAWRQLADHCRDSLRRADPVAGPRPAAASAATSRTASSASVVEVTAVSVGHDLSLGTSAVPAHRGQARGGGDRGGGVTDGLLTYLPSAASRPVRTVAEGVELALDRAHHQLLRRPRARRRGACGPPRRPVCAP